MVIKTAANTATISSTTADSDASNNTSEADVTITAGDSKPSTGPVCSWWAWWRWWHHSGWSHR